jgi:AraC-like DNA-binding protein
MDEQSNQNQSHNQLSNDQHRIQPNQYRLTESGRSKQAIDPILRQILSMLTPHLASDSKRSPLGGVGIFHCLQPQALRDVPIHQAIAVLVVSGRKIILVGERKIEVDPGELLLLPGGCTVEVGNHPGPLGEPYLGLAMSFSQQTIEQLRRAYGTEIPADTRPHWRAVAPKDMVAAMAQWVDWCLHHPPDPTLSRHRQVEILMLLARTGIAGNLLIARHSAWGEQVVQLIAQDPAKEWSAAMVCQRLGIGESTLRRHLSQEGVGFRQLLEECRMVTSLALLQETYWPVGQVAEAVGYKSHSRFSERFKRRFGLSPVELKKTRESGRE